jgi:hypothetical protein
MNRLLFFALFLGLGPLLIPTAAVADDIDDLIDAARKKKSSSLDLYYEAQYDGDIDTDKAVKIPAKTLDLPWGELKLSAGWLVPVVPAELTEDTIGDKTVPDRNEIAAVFVGEGSFQFDVPHPTERWSLNKNLKELGVKDADFDSLNADLNGGVVLLFNGRWGALLREGGEAAAMDSKSARSAKRMWKARGDLWFDSASAMSTLDAARGKDRDFLILEIPTKTFKSRIPWLSYSYDPNANEAVGLEIHKRSPLNRDSIDSWSLVSWFSPERHAAHSISENTLAAADYDLDAQHYSLEMRIYRDNDEGAWGMDVQGSARFTVGHTTSVADLRLFSKANGYPVKLAWVRDDEGNDLPFMHKAGSMVVQLARTYNPGDELTLTFSYDGLMIAAFTQPAPQTSLTDEDAAGAVVGIANYSLNDNDDWYPKNRGHSDFYTFDWKVTTPKPMVAVTSGTLLSMTQEGKRNIHVIRETTPVAFPAMVFGKFVIRENDPDYDKGEIKIRVYNHPGFEKDAQLIIDEAQGILAYYSHLYGDYAYKELDICQWPLGSGGAQAPAGLIRMTGETYISKTDLVNLYGVADPHIRDALLPHEIGHEWWGHIAGFSSYRDQWVSETFAEYSSALYLEERQKRRSGDPDDLSGYEASKSEWMMRRRAHLTHRTAPLWLGARMNSAKRNYWQSSAYARGPLILDMLRHRHGKEAVLKFMYTYLNHIKTNRSGATVSGDIQRVLETVLPEVKFDQFMADYVYGNKVIEGFESKQRKKR